MRDWEPVKANAINEVQQRHCFGCIKQSATIFEAIGEIEQLRLEVGNTIALKEYDAEQYEIRLDAKESEIVQCHMDYEQLRQDKAELVNVLKDLIRIRDHFISKRDFDLLESLPDTWEQAKKLLTKHGGAK